MQTDEPDSEAVRRLCESLGEVMAQFADDCAQDLWTWLPVTTVLAARAATAFARLPRLVFLRAADALHLVCAQEHAHAPG